MNRPKLPYFAVIFTSLLDKDVKQRDVKQKHLGLCVNGRRN
ncbi:hypothetical protein GCHA_1305 [Paraglaciecola chathamensis S18K6]|uniref:Uncharacterized protein n=1 Tax=Paraglaciecola chathamensis S18K6 TaxID=1127672 RepID=A0AAV3UW49_9ALTE|nr:hypothetical protein GCHA_1305 [Paraglaciecola chathamensis S18K6]